MRLIDSLRIQNGDIHFNPKVISQDNVPQYEALSYVWGVADDPKMIWIDGKMFKFHQNLWQFLRHAAEEQIQVHGYDAYSPGSL